MMTLGPSLGVSGGTETDAQQPPFAPHRQNTSRLRQKAHESVILSEAKDLSFVFSNE
jgi:hypothetical protein